MIPIEGKFTSRGIGGAIAAALAVSSIPAQADAARPIVGVESVKGPGGQEVPFLRTMIETAIIGTGRFTVMDSNQLDALLRGQARCTSGTVRARSGNCQRGGFVDPNYRISATVTSAGSSKQVGTQTMFGFLAGPIPQGSPACTSATAALSLDIRITDKDTSQIKAGGRIDLRSRKPVVDCGPNAAANNGDLTELAREAAQGIAAKLVFASFPIEVLAAQPGHQVVLSYGQDVLKIGEQFDIFRKAKSVIDSKGQSYQIDSPVGTVQVVSVAPRTSIASLLCTVGGADATAGDVARPAAHAQARVKPPKGSSLPGECK